MGEELRAVEQRLEGRGMRAGPRHNEGDRRLSRSPQREDRPDARGCASQDPSAALGLGAPNTVDAGSEVRRSVTDYAVKH